MWRLAILVLLSGCELRGLTHAQLFGPADAGSAPDTSEPAVPDAAPVGPEAAPDLALAPDAARDAGPDLPPPPPEGIIVTGFVSGVCHGESVPVGGAGFHTCAYQGKGSYRLRIRNISPGTRVEIGARLAGYLPDPATAVITLEATGNTQNFELRPASGSCATVPDAGPCVCDPAMGCEPS